LPKNEVPARLWEPAEPWSSPRAEGKLRSLTGTRGGQSPADGPPSAAEGAELIRAFLMIERHDVRDAILGLVRSLSGLGSLAE
jgi:hypothetical protein